MGRAVQPAGGRRDPYERRRPEDPLPAVEEHLETFLAQVELETRASLPAFVKEDFDAFFQKGISISCSMLSQATPYHIDLRGPRLPRHLVAPPRAPYNVIVGES